METRRHGAGDACFGVKFVYVRGRLDDVDTEVNDAIDTARSRASGRLLGAQTSWDWKSKARMSRCAGTGKGRQEEGTGLADKGKEGRQCGGKGRLQA